MERLVDSVKAQIRAQRQLERPDLAFTMADGDEIGPDRINYSVFDDCYSDSSNATVILTTTKVFSVIL